MGSIPWGQGGKNDVFGFTKGQCASPAVRLFSSSIHCVCDGDAGQIQPAVIEKGQAGCDFCGT